MAKPASEWAALLQELRDANEELEGQGLLAKASGGDDEEKDTDKPTARKGEDEEDKDIAAMADGDADDDDIPDNKDEDEDEGKDGDDDDELFGKSFDVRTDDGARMQAYDGTELVKSLIDQQQIADGQIRAVARQSQLLTKALVTAIKAKDAELETLREDVSTMRKALLNLAGKGKGRKTAVTIHDRSEPRVQEQAATPEEILSKANAAAEAGRITWREYAGVDTSLRMRQPIDQRVLSRLDG